MPGSVNGGLRAAATIKAKDPDFYKKIGRLGGKKSRGGGFSAYVDCSCSVFPYKHYIKNCAGKIGGKISKRGKAK